MGIVIENDFTVAAPPADTYALMTDVERVGPCTSCRTDLLHSYRREPQTRGRQLSWIGWCAGGPESS